MGSGEPKKDVKTLGTFWKDIFMRRHSQRVVANPDLVQKMWWLDFEELVKQALVEGTFASLTTHGCILNSENLKKGVGWKLMEKSTKERYGTRWTVMVNFLFDETNEIKNDSH